jgi:hypothetical protein
VLLILSDVILCVVYILSVVLVKNYDYSCDHQDWDLMPNSLEDGYLHFKPAIPLSKKTQNRMAFVPVKYLYLSVTPQKTVLLVFFYV